MHFYENEKKVLFAHDVCDTFYVTEHFTLLNTIYGQ